MDISSHTSELIESIRIIMDPYSLQERRNAANQVCQNFKENSLHCVPCGLFLSSKDHDPLVRHFGLQLIEHTIKFRWNNMTAQEKLQLKNSVLDLLNSGTNDILTEHCHIKDMLSRLVVEIIKREWPQQWPNMLPELNNACLKGETQTELVMLVFLRLAEDVALLPCLPNRRRKDIQQALNVYLKDLLAFFLKTLTASVEKYTCLVASVVPEQKQEMLVHKCLSITVLKTLNSFLEWVPWSHITENNLLLQMLCTLLNHIPFRLFAVDCLQIIVERKGKADNRTPLLVLFSDDAMSVIFSAARSAASGDPLDEEHYLFFKRLCQFLVGMGTLLGSLWGTVADIKEPSTFSIYLNSIVTFTQHPSLLLNDFTLTIWTSFFQHSVISKNQYVCSVIRELIPILTKKLLKIGIPSRDDSPSCFFSRLDFPSDEIFLKFFVQFRDRLLRIIKLATKLQPTTCFQWGADALNKCLVPNGKLIGTLCAAEIEVLASYLDAVNSQLNSDNNLELCREGIVLLKNVLEFQTEDFSVMSELLSCISAFIIFLKIDNELLPLILTKLFCSTAFTVCGNKADSNPALKDFRKHAAACIVRMSIDHGRLLLPAFPQMAAYVKNLVSTSGTLYFHEKALLLETLVIISNELHDYEKQVAFLKETFEPVLEPWTNIKRKMDRVEEFIQYTGLRELNPSGESKEETSNNRSQIIHMLNVIAGLVRRCKWPKNVEIAEKGGFLVRHSHDNGYTFKHAASQIVLIHLDGIFNFIKCINSLYKMPLKSSFHSSLFDIPEGELRLILEHAWPEKCDEAVLQSLETKLKNFVYFTYETSLQILGMCAQSLQLDFNLAGDISLAVRTSVLTPLECLPDYRLKSILHFYLKVLFTNCPPLHSNLVISVLEHLCPYMFQKLSLWWQRFEEQYGTSIGYEDKMTEMQEILEDQLSRRLTREYFETLGSLLRSKGSSQEASIDAMDEDSQHKPQLTTPLGEKLSEMGALIFKNENLRSLLVCTCFKAIRWLDTSASHRSNYICIPIFNQLVHDGLIRTLEEASFLLESSLSALWLLGEHDMNQASLITLALLIYETLRPKFPNLHDTLLKLSKCDTKELMKLDDMILSTELKVAKDKKKRELFKFVVADVIGKNVGQQFKNRINIRNLRPLSSSRPKVTLREIFEDDKDGLCAFFADEWKRK